MARIHHASPITDTVNKKVNKQTNYKTLEILKRMPRVDQEKFHKASHLDKELEAVSSF